MSTQTEQAETQAETQTPAQTVERFVAALEGKDVGTVTAMLTDDASIVFPFSGSGDAADAPRFDGKEATLGYYRNSMSLMGRVRWVNAEISVVAGGRAVFFEANGDLTTAEGTPYRNV